MKRATALAISARLADRGALGVQHTIDFNPSYGYTVRVREEAMTDELRDRIGREFDKRPVHGVEYR